MSKFENLEQLAEFLGDGGPFNPDESFENVGQVVDSLVNLGNTEEVFARHDDHLGLKMKLSAELLASPLDGIDEGKFQSEIEEILDQANIIGPLWDREQTEEDLAEIEEDKQSRGVDIED